MTPDMESNPDSKKSGFSSRSLAEALQKETRPELDTRPTEHEVRFTAEARETLEQWGLTEEHRAELAKIAGELEYANPVGKTRGIAERGGTLISENGVEP